MFGCGVGVLCTSLATGMTYDIRAAQQPPGETCSVSNGAGTMGAADLANIAVVCAPLSYTVGGSVAGLRGTLVLQDNGGDDLTLTSDGDFQFATPIASGASYRVSIIQQPTGPNETCVVANGADKVVAANVSGISIVCTTATYFVNVVVSGVQGSGLVLQDNGGDDLPIASDGSYVFATPIEDGQAYNVLVATQPSSPDQTCTADPGGTINGGDVTVNVTCQ